MGKVYWPCDEEGLLVSGPCSSAHCPGQCLGLDIAYWLLSHWTANIKGLLVMWCRGSPIFWYFFKGPGHCWVWTCPFGCSASGQPMGNRNWSHDIWGLLSSGPSSSAKFETWFVDILYWLSSSGFSQAPEDWRGVIRSRQHDWSVVGLDCIAGWLVSTPRRGTGDGHVTAASGDTTKSDGQGE